MTSTSPKAGSSLLSRAWETYTADTPQSLRVLDLYLGHVLLSGIALFVYMALVGTYPYNAFLSAFSSCVGSFVLAGIYILSLSLSLESPPSLNPPIPTYIQPICACK